MKKYILAFETSCDDTSVAIIDNKYNVLVNLISSQQIHNEFGGVVPELASRLHLKNIQLLLHMALKQAHMTLDEISAIAVSVNPGLIGALIVGVSFAKSLAFSIDKPIISINHMIGHLYANKIETPELKPPYLALIISGGHTELVHFISEKKYKIIGKTVDDAVGEAFDKTAKLLRLGYPGGPIIDKLSKNGNPNFYKFPRALPQKDNYNFSFSGLKTAVLRFIEDKTTDYIDKNKENIAASVQKAIIDVLTTKTIRFAKKNKINRIVLAGGVSANTALRKEFIDKTKQENIALNYPPLKYCMDNAAMIGAAAIDKLEKKQFADLTLNAFSTKGTKFI